MEDFIFVLEFISLIIFVIYLKEVKKMSEVAVKAMEELQEYREIGTVEECREAIEKTKEKKPDYEGDGYADGHMVYDIWICPCCGERYEIDYEEYEHCPKCGQAIDWSVEETGEDI